MRNALLQARLGALPHSPGVYLFKDAQGRVIYVGKAAILHSRVSSYFTTHNLEPKVHRMVEHIHDFEILLTDSEQEAFLLECNLIKEYRPQYNVRLRDDKTYPYLKVGLGEKWPRVHMTRRIEQDGSRYFGPYANAGSLRRTIAMLKRLFPFRSCRKDIDGTDSRPCLEFHIKRCLGPCIGEVSPEEYGRIIEQVVMFMEGRQEEVLRQLNQKMTAAADRLEFEKAVVIRDQILAVQDVVEQQKIASAEGESDAIAFSQAGDQAYVQVFIVRNGKLIGREHFMLTGVEGEEPGQIMTGFLQQYYSSTPVIPRTVLVEHMPRDPELICEWLKEKRGGSVEVRAPRRGVKKQLVDLVATNAREGLRQARVKVLADPEILAEALDEVKERLSLPSKPLRIECYDISNIHGRAAVGSMVVFEGGLPRKDQYRRFRIGSVVGIDDYAMVREVLRRRFKRGLEMAEEGGWANEPDLVLIDGGKGHLGAAVEVLREVGLELPCAGIAKENEAIYVPGEQGPVMIARDAPALYLIQRIRDEAHRFAIGYHRQLHKKLSHTATLEGIPGIGAKRNRALLRKFGSVKRIREASIEELASVKGMNRIAAARLKEYI